MHPRHRSSATWLALAYALLVLYASLFPFEGWGWPPGRSLLETLVLPAAIHHDTFDRWSNSLGYVPLALLTALALLRSGYPARWSLPLAVLLAALLSYGCEWLQVWIPTRVPSRGDFLLNSVGAMAGAMMAWGLQMLGLVDRWSRFRQRWFTGDAAYALALLVLWPVALLFPSPVPLGLGHGLDRARETLLELLDGVSWAASLQPWLEAPAANLNPLSPLAELMVTALGLLAPCLVAYAVTPRGWRRLGLVLGAAALALAGMTLSTALNFGPEHALAWIGPRTLPALATGLVMAVLCVALPVRLVAGVGLMTLAAMMTLLAQAPSDPYLAQSLQAWEQGRFVRFHGLAQWLGWLWPWLGMVWLLSRLAVVPRRGA